MTSLSPRSCTSGREKKFLAEARSNRDATADNFKNVNNVTSHLYKKEFRKEKKDEENCLNHTLPCSLCNCNSSALSPCLPPDVRVYPREHMSRIFFQFFVQCQTDGTSWWSYIDEIHGKCYYYKLRWIVLLVTTSFDDSWTYLTKNDDDECSHDTVDQCRSREYANDIAGAFRDGEIGAGGK